MRLGNLKVLSVLLAAAFAAAAAGAQELTPMGAVQAGAKRPSISTPKPNHALTSKPNLKAVTRLTPEIWRAIK